MESIGYKLFEERRGEPCTLVHGMPSGFFREQRSRIFELGKWVEKEPDTPGFNFFLDFEILKLYLPRFKVRAPRLFMCSIYVDNVTHKLNSNYYLAEKIFIKPSSWRNRIQGCDIL
jgi:hypothetical protein